MKNPEEKLVSNIQKWSKTKERLVVGIDGYSGSGKTTFSKIISEKLDDVLIIHIDEHIDTWKKRKNIIDKSENKIESIKKHYFKYGNIEKIIQKFKKNPGSVVVELYDQKYDTITKTSIDLNKKVLIIDGILIFDPKNPIDKYLDKRVYIKTKTDDADRRRQDRDSKDFKENFIPDDSPSNWIHIFKKIYSNYVERVNPSCKADLIIHNKKIKPKHNFIISTTRPELLKRQIISFYGIRKNRDLGFYIFDDSLDKSSLFKKEIHKITKAYPKIDIKYYDLEEQKRIIVDYSENNCNKLNLSPETIIECFKEGGKLKGIRSIQNKSVFIFYLKNNDINSIVHKIDDDVLPYTANRGLDDWITIEPTLSFFSDKEKALSGKDNSYTGSNFTIDSPSPLVQHIDFMEFIFNFIKHANLNKHNQKLGNDISNISPSGAKGLRKTNNLLELFPVSEEKTYTNVFAKIPKYIEYYKNGISRVVINDNKLETKDNNCKEVFFPGGCISFFYKNIPTLTPNFGNQDLLWELFETLDNKHIFASGYVGHTKIPSNRVSILDDLKDTSYKHQTSITYTVFDYLKKNNQGTSLKDFESNFINVMTKWLAESKEFVNQTLEILNNKNSKIYQTSEKNLIVLKQIRKFLFEIDNSYPEIEKNYSNNAKINTEAIVKNYYKQKKIFDRIMLNITKDNE